MRGALAAGLWCAGALVIGEMPIPAIAGAGGVPPEERAKIESLLVDVKDLSGAVFIRNGKEYSSATAATFLRRKWKSRETTVSSARDFLERIASFSSTTGRPYWIRFRDGTTVPCGDYLGERLRELERIPAPRDTASGGERKDR